MLQLNARELLCLLEVCGGIGVLPEVWIIVPTLVSETCINLDVHSGLPLGIIWHQPLQPSQTPLLRCAAGLNHEAWQRGVHCLKHSSNMAVLGHLAGAPTFTDSFKVLGSKADRQDKQGRQQLPFNVMRNCWHHTFPVFRAPCTPSGISSIFCLICCTCSRQAKLPSRLPTVVHSLSSMPQRAPRTTPKQSVQQWCLCRVRCTDMAAM